MLNITELIVNLGKKLGFDAETEVPASLSAWVDVVWYDNRFRFPKPSASETLLRVPKLPVVGFEIESSSALNAKHVKGSVSNLNNLGPSMGVIILGKANLDALRKKTGIHRNKSDKELWDWLIEKVKLWIYAEAKPNIRIVVMREDELVEWAKREGVY
jgi:hypothetical protein